MDGYPEEDFVFRGGVGFHVLFDGGVGFEDGRFAGFVGFFVGGPEEVGLGCHFLVALAGYGIIVGGSVVFGGLFAASFAHGCCCISVCLLIERNENGDYVAIACRERESGWRLSEERREPSSWLSWQTTVILDKMRPLYGIKWVSLGRVILENAGKRKSCLPKSRERARVSRKHKCRVMRQSTASRGNTAPIFVIFAC